MATVTWHPDGTRSVGPTRDPMMQLLEAGNPSLQFSPLLEADEPENDIEQHLTIEAARPAPRRTSTTSTTNARAQWRAAIAAKVADGLDPSRARSAVAREQPLLRQAVIAEANPGRPISQDMTRARGKGPATQAWNRVVAAKMANGLTRSRAVAAVVKEASQLHQQYLDEVNGR